MNKMTKAEMIAKEIRQLNGLKTDAIMVPSYDKYSLIICKVDPRQLVLPEGYYYDGELLTNKANPRNGYYTFKIQRK